MKNALLTVLMICCTAASGHAWNTKSFPTALVDLRMNITQVQVNVTHQELHLTVDPGKRYIQGIVTTTFHPEFGSLTELQINLHSDLRIDSVLNDAGQSLSFDRYNDHTTDIHLSDTVQTGTSSHISIYYQGVPPEDGFGSFVQEAHATDSIIWTLSEPYGAQDWWPCRQNLSDKIDSLDLRVSVPSGYRAAGNGILISEKPQNDGTVIFHWKHRYPIATYLVAFTVTNYQVHKFEIELQNGPLPIVNYLYPQDYDRHSQQIESILPGMMQLFEELFIPYPFDKEKYGHAQFGFGGGMEHQTMSFMGGFSYSLTAHELAHQWFGDYITCGSWQDIWLNEGFASYLTALTYERILKNGSFEKYLTSTISSVTSQPGGTVFVQDTVDFRRIFNSRLSYNKAGMILHMARWILGEEYFFKGVRQYLLDEDTRYSYARTRHLIDHFEDVSGFDLDEFFEDWYKGEGYPSYHLQWFNSNSGIRMIVNQSTSSTIPFFEIPLEVGVYGTGRDSLIRLDIQENGQVFDAELEWKVDSISIDPRHWLISAGNTAEVITNSFAGNREDGWISVYPNPASNLLTIQNSGPYDITELTLYSFAGTLIKNWSVNIGESQTTTINLDEQKPGFYLLIMQNQSGILSPRKIIIR